MADDVKPTKTAEPPIGGFTGAGAPTNPWAGVTPASFDSLEALARALNEAVASTQAALVDGAMSGRGPIEAGLGNPDPFHVASDAARVWGRLAADPTALAEAQMRLWRGYMELWGSAARRLAGEAPPPEPVTDKRFKDADWSENPVFDIIRQSYLVTSNWLNDTITNVEGVDEQTKRKVAFFTRQMSDAFAPTNFALTNPEVLRETFKTNGENLARGLRNLAEDLERGRGRLSIRQTDLDRFVVGKDVAATEGKVIFRNDFIELIQYSPRTEQVYERPLLIFPPWINKFYIMDLRPENSMVRWLSDQGYTVFLASWVNPGPEYKDVTFEDYMRQGIFAGVDAVIEQTGVAQVNTVGYCIGGTLLSSTLAYMAKTGDERIASATFFAAQSDFSEAGDLLMFVSDEWLGEIARRMDENGGVLDGGAMSDVFNMLRANDLVWSFFINNYLMGKDPRAFDLLFWNADQTRLPKTLHLYYLDQFYRKNALTKGELNLGGLTLTQSDVSIPVYFQASKEDHIAPFRSVYKGAKRFSGPVRFMLAGSGHIAGVINPPAAKKYQHWVNNAQPLPATVDAWLAGAVETPGSWWDDWNAWLSARSGERIPARDPSAGPLGVLEDAPGAFVRVKS